MNPLTKVGRLVAAYGYSPAVVPVLLRAAWHRRLPNTRESNRALWGWHDWSEDGDEWSNMAVPGWKEGVVANLLSPFISETDTVLEIGPGSGRWTQYIVDRAARTILVDITPECIEMCRQRFGDKGNVEFHVNDGKSLRDVKSGVVDKIWSFDVFVHIQPVDVDAYVAEFRRVLKPGGQALIHHAKNGSTASSSWRSEMTASEMKRIVENHGLQLVDQFESWGGGSDRLWPRREPEDNPDVISRIAKPAH
jgi:ubiquinone/menaquinone biosynthesis C-methylase UbiE